MKGDFSRIRFNRRKNYTAVLEQQGRVALDADANEQSFIDEDLRRSETVDVVGEYGGPAGDAGFTITVADGDILIGAGRYYVAGLVCDNPASLCYDRQPFLIGPAPSGATLLTELANANGADVLQVFLEVWQRFVTGLDDPCLREPALGQADTTARLQTVWRVVAELVTTDTPSQPTPGPAETSQPTPGPGERSRPTPGPAGMTPCCQQMYATAPQHSTGTMSAGTSGPSADCGCEPIAAAGYQGIENQLYRVEIHQPGDETMATFKWSRENASVVSAVTSVSGSTVWLDSLGPDANLGFQAQQWVELIDDTYLFGEEPNQPGTLYQIQSVQPADCSLTLTGPAIAVDPGRNARLRRWDQAAPSAVSGGLPLSAGTWLQLENGIQVSFTKGSYHSGDYWTIPARTASGQIDWPPCGGDGNAYQPSQSVRVYRAPLACLHSTTIEEIFGGKVTKLVHTTVDDCRQLFSPLTDLIPTADRQAIHVESINWANDDIMTLDHLVANGLVVTLDQAPSSPITAATFVVTVEPVTTPAKDIELEALPSTVLRGVTVVDSEITVTAQTLSWLLPFAETSLAQRLTVEFLDQMLRIGAPVKLFARARVRLLGEMIFANAPSGPIYLDGRAFGQAALRHDGITPRVDLRLPSGDQSAASDLEAWFYLAPVLRITSLTIAYPALTVVLDANGNVTGVQATVSGKTELVNPTATVTVSYPAVTGTVIALTLLGDQGTGSVASIPATAPIAAGHTSSSFPLTILANPGFGDPPPTLTFEITASLNNAAGLASAQSATFTVTGVLQLPQ